jgi:hypothetical protein
MNAFGSMRAPAAKAERPYEYRMYTEARPPRDGPLSEARRVSAPG